MSSIITHIKNIVYVSIPKDQGTVKLWTRYLAFKSNYLTFLNIWKYFQEVACKWLSIPILNNVIIQLAINFSVTIYSQIQMLVILHVELIMTSLNYLVLPIP